MVYEEILRWKNGFATIFIISKTGPSGLISASRSPPFLTSKMRTEKNSEFRIQNSELRKILLVRNDNIGDLVCSIPAIQLVRTHFPKAEIDILVNSYNAPIVEPLVPKWVDRLVIYQKTKHVGFSISQLFHLIQFYSQLRLAKYDTVILLVGG